MVIRLIMVIMNKNVKKIYSRAIDKIEISILKDQFSYLEFEKFTDWLFGRERLRIFG